MSKRRSSGRAGERPAGATARWQLTADAPAIAQAKAALRQQVIETRLHQTDAERRRFDDARQALVLGLLDDLRRDLSGGCLARLAVGAPTASIYLSQPPEPDTLRLVSSLQNAGWRFVVPSPGDGARPWMEPSWAWYAEPLHVASRGIPVPADCSHTPPGWPPAGLDVVDVIIMPGLAGAMDGSRLGYGGGWYDRALSAVSSGVPRWLLLNDAELIDALPHDAHDQPVDLIVTPSGVCRAGYT